MSFEGIARGIAAYFVLSWWFGWIVSWAPGRNGPLEKDELYKAGQSWAALTISVGVGLCLVSIKLFGERLFDLFPSTMNPRLVVQIFVVASAGLFTVIAIVRSYLLAQTKVPPGLPEGSSDPTN